MSRRQVRRSIRHYIFDSSQILRLRLSAGLTQEAVARNVGVALRTVQRWEHGDAAPNPDQRVALAGLLGVDPDDLYVEEEPAA